MLVKNIVPDILSKKNGVAVCQTSCFASPFQICFEGRAKLWYGSRP